MYTFEGEPLGFTPLKRIVHSSTQPMIAIRRLRKMFVFIPKLLFYSSSSFIQEIRKKRHFSCKVGKEMSGAKQELFTHKRLGSVPEVMINFSTSRLKYSFVYENAPYLSDLWRDKISEKRLSASMFKM
jgi:hypothetical protein